MSIRHFISLADLPESALDTIIQQAILWKQEGAHLQTHMCKGLSLATMFDKPSTRTRISFSLAAQQLGMHLIDLNTETMHFRLGKETLGDTARMLSGFVDAVMYRTNTEETFDALMRHLSIPLINGLSDRSHPCQIVADLMTVTEIKGSLSGLTILWVGDYNNVARSWAEAALHHDFTLRISSPHGYHMDDKEYQNLMQQGAKIERIADPMIAATGVQVINTDVWVSMGDVNKDARMQALAPYQVNNELLACADKEVTFLHCLPAIREQEVTSSVLDGNQSAAWQQAENRLHAQKAILAWVLHRL